MKKLSRNAPRDLPGGHWYYVSDRSVDVIAHGEGARGRMVTLREIDLVRMISELRPKRKRTATKRRDAKRAATTVGAKRHK